MNKYKKAQELINNFGNIKIRHRLSSYIGKGRPKKSDYVVCKIKELDDVIVFDMFNNALSTSYTN